MANAKRKLSFEVPESVSSGKLPECIVVSDTADAASQNENRSKPSQAINSNGASPTLKIDRIYTDQSGSHPSTMKVIAFSESILTFLK